MKPDRDPASATGPDRSEHPEVVDPFDPVALEERLREARIRREHVLTSRYAGRSAPSPTRNPVKAASPRGRRAFRIAAMFVAGAGVGAAAVLTSEPLLHRANWALGPGSEPATAQASERPEAVGAAPVLPMPGPTESDIRAGYSDIPPSDLPPPWRIASASARVPASGFTPIPEVRIPERLAFPSRMEALPPARSAGLADLKADLTAGSLSQPEPPSRAASAPRARTAWTVAPPFTGALSVYLNVPSTVPDEIARAAVETLREATSAEVFLASVTVPISRTNVRYYHDRDSAAAGRIAGLLDPAADGSLADLRDFTDYDPKPEPGTVEIWFAGDAPAIREVAAAPVADAPRQAAVRLSEPRATPDGAAGFVGAVGRSLAALLRSSDGPPVSVATRGESGPAASGFRGVIAPSARASSGGNAPPAPSSPFASKPSPGGSPARTSAPVTRSQQSAPATRGATGVSPSRSSGDFKPASPTRSGTTSSTSHVSKSGTSGAAATNSPAKGADGGAVGRSGGGGKSKSDADKGAKNSAGGKSKGADSSNSAKSKAADRSNSGKSKGADRSGGGRSSSKDGGKSKGGKNSGGKRK